MPVRLSGLETFKKIVDREKRNARNKVDNIIKTEVERAYRDIQAMTPVDTGFLKSSEGYKKIENMKWKVFAQAPYAGYVEHYYMQKYNISWWNANLTRAVDLINHKLEQYFGGKVSANRINR